ncbi:MAG TPA: beta-galactosidase [Verrucomicrobiae bacterium]|nr:beta-galactosidase [Verrucomicrobiae bacterium]
MRRTCIAGLFLLWAIPGLSAAETNHLRPWLEYRTIMWVGDSAYHEPKKLPLFFQRLREMGVNTAMAYGDGDLQPLLENHFPYYVENMINRGLCLKWNSKVRDWDNFITDWSKAGRPESGLVRDYCLDDPEWTGWAKTEMQKLARKNREHQPVAYNIRDELSVTFSANPFDYDFNPLALESFRRWLQTQYQDLAALNSEWDTRFETWDQVKPFTTDQIKERMASGQSLPRGKPDWGEVAAINFDPVQARQNPARWNFSPWADFRTYMDISLARTLDGLRQAAHQADPSTPVGIEGTQMPHAFGGYDLWRLSQALDWVEPYDIGCSREIFGSFMPGQPIVTTVFEKETKPARRRLWHLLLEGDRGCIIWWSEDCLDWKSPQYALKPKARALEPVLKEMTSPLARLFLRAQPVRDPVFIHYSQPSIQADWLLESTVDGPTWLRRFSSFESDHNRLAKVRDSWLKAFQDLGFSPQFLSSEQIQAGQLRQVPGAVLALPGSLALSQKEEEEIQSFLSDGHTLLGSGGPPGAFDQHGKLRTFAPIKEFQGLETAPLQSCFALTPAQRPSFKPGDISAGLKDRLKAQPDFEWARWIQARLGSIAPQVLVPLEARARIHRFRVAKGQLLAFEHNIDYQMSEELKQAGGNEALEQPVHVEATLKTPMHVYDLRAQKYLGHTARLQFTLAAWQPSLFALTPEPLKGPDILDALSESGGGG